MGGCRWNHDDAGRDRAGSSGVRREKVHLSRISFNQLFDVCERLIAMPRVDRAAFGPMHPGRVDVIGGGAIITTVLAQTFEVKAGITELVVSEHDILDGIAMSVAQTDPIV